MEQIEVNIKVVNERVENINDKTSQYLSDINLRFSETIKGVNQGWNDHLQGSSELYIESSRNLMSDLTANMTRAQNLTKEISDAMILYLENETQGVTQLQKIDF